MRNIRKIRFARFITGILPVHDTQPEGGWLAMSFTVPNCGIHELRDTIQSVNQAWKSMRQQSVFSHLLGTARGIKIRRDAADGTVAFKVNALLHVEPGWVGQCCSPEQWAAAWSRCAG